MREMKDSGIEWVGQIPKGWELRRAKTLFTQRNSKGNGIEVLLSPTQKYGVVPQSQLEGVVQVKEDTDLQMFKTVHKGDFVISLRSFQGGFEYSLYEGVCSPAYQVFYPTSPICDTYYRYLFKSQSFISKMNNLTVGIREGKNIQYVDFANSQIPVPPLAEQERIAAFLDAECAEIDTVLEKTRASIEEYKKLKQAVITQAVTKGIRGDRPMKNSSIEWIGDIPAEWSVVPFSKFARVSANLVNPSDYQDYLQVSPENIEKDSGKLLPCKTVSEVGVESWNHFFHKGQILYSKIRPKLNKVCIAPFDGLCSADMYPIDTDNISKFVVYTILSNDFNQQVAMITENRVKMPKINQKELSKIIVVLPADRMEQQEIVDYLDGECGKIDALAAKKQQYLTEIENYKKSLIYEYVTGKKEVV